MLMRFIGYLTLDTLVGVPHSTQPEVLPDACHCPSVWGRTGFDRGIQGASFIIESARWKTSQFSTQISRVPLHLANWLLFV